VAAFDLTAANAILKTLYPQNEIKKLCYQNQPFFAMVKKRSDFYGNNMQIGLRYGAPTGRSAAIATATANKAASKLAKFTVTRIKDYVALDLDGEALRACANDKGAIVRALELEVDGGFHVLKRSIGIQLFRGGTGTRGQISAGSNVGTPTITLANINDVTNFEVGMLLQASQTDGGALRSAGATVTLTAVDRQAGTLTASGNWSAGIAAVAASDFILANGDSNLTISGLAAWVPVSNPTSTPFFGLDRTPDVIRLGGCRITAFAGGPIEETLQQAAAFVGREGGDPDWCFLNNIDYVKLATALGSRLTVQMNDIPDVGFGFESIELSCPTGKISVFADPNCPQGKAYMLTSDCWTFWTLGDVGFLEEDGLRMLRNASADTYEMRLGYYGNLVCDAPGFNAYVAL
jgi:hypothetical protein